MLGRKRPAERPRQAELVEACTLAKEANRDMFHVYILKCADDSYYTGMTNNLERRLAQHQKGTVADGYTASRRPVELAWSETFATHDEAFRRERQIKGWSRAKKEALIGGDWQEIQRIVKDEHDRRQLSTGSGSANAG